MVIIVPRIAVLSFKKFSLTPKSSLSSTSEINKHPGLIPEADHPLRLFPRISKGSKKWLIHPAAITRSTITVLTPEGNGLCLEGHDNVLLRLDKGLAPFTFGEDVQLVGSNSSSSSWAVKSLLMSLGVA